MITIKNINKGLIYEIVIINKGMFYLLSIYLNYFKSVIIAFLISNEEVLSPRRLICSGKTYSTLVILNNKRNRNRLINTLSF